ncbi:hypothetical protein FJK98_32870 [Micromonospora sp. HM134]|uniref:hypothetical protein n=1 Tax=Micromonospora sp. HM134 TaxID=2583243 RepID=UPI0011985A28|nr:hypothetical protein [Micromonospora sp. HM134]QDY11331.1 hypothetical protein FJK98_32870 [Micromonospora sp. HM134]
MQSPAAPPTEHGTTKRTGRPLNPVVGFGPAAQLAQKLRDAYLAAGEPPMKRVARQGDVGRSTLSENLGGRKIPSLRALNAFLIGIGVTNEVARDWRRLREEAAEAAERFDPDGRIASSSGLLVALRRLRAEQRLTDEELERRLDAVSGERLKGALSGSVPRRAQVDAILAGEVDLDPDALGYLVLCLGAHESQVRAWRTLTDRLGKQQAEPRDLVSDPLVASAPAADGVIASGAAAEGTPGPSIARLPRRRWQRLAAVALAAVSLVLLGMATADRRRDRVSPDNGRAGGPAVEDATDGQDEIFVLGQRIVVTPQPAFGREDAVITRLVVSRTITSSQVDAYEKREFRRTVIDGQDCESSTLIHPDDRREPEPTQCTASTQTRVRVPDPSTDPQELSRQLLVDQGAEPGSKAESLATLRGIANLNKEHCLGSAQRAAVLRVLADLPGLVFRDWSTDAMGRQGLAFSIDGEAPKKAVDTRDTLVIDPDHGGLLLHELAVRPESPVPVVESGTTFLDCELRKGRD